MYPLDGAHLIFNYLGDPGIHKYSLLGAVGGGGSGSGPDAGDETNMNCD